MCMCSMASWDKLRKDKCCADQKQPRAIVLVARVLLMAQGTHV